MNSRYPLIKMGQFLRLRKEFFTINDAEEYQLVTVQLHARGIRERSRLLGSEIKTKKQQRVKAGDLLVAEIDAKVGGYGIVPSELDGAIVSGHYFLYEIDKNKIVPEYLGFFIQTGYPEQELQQFVKGSVNYAAIRSQHFFELEIPLPPLEDQRCLVKKIEVLLAPITTAKSLIQNAITNSEFLLSSLLYKLIDQKKYPITLLEAIVSEPLRNGLGPQQEVESNGRRMLRINSVSSSIDGRVDLYASKMVSVIDAVAAPFVIKDQDVFLVRYNGDINRVAKAAVYRGPATDHIYPDKLIRVRVDQSRIIPEYLVLAFETRIIREQVEELGKTTSGQIGISGKSLYSFRIPVPPLLNQQQIISLVENVRKKQDEMIKHQRDINNELEDLKTSILNNAFNGKL